VVAHPGEFSFVVGVSMGFSHYLTIRRSVRSLTHAGCGTDARKRGRLPNFGFDKVSGMARDVKAFLNRQGGSGRGAAPDVEQRREDQAEDPKSARRRVYEQRIKLKSKRLANRQELSRIRKEIDAAEDPAGRSEQIKRAKKKKLEMFDLKNELRAAKGQVEGDELGTGALPDFAVIGAAKCGTTYFYHLLTKHPLVQPAAFKEPHYFDLLVDDEGVEWYRRCFPRPKWKNGRRTITGEASPGYLFHALAPERMAEVVPEARLIALLRNPVDRTYSAYHHRVRNGQETRTFEAAVDANLDGPDQAPWAGQPREHLSRSVYVDHLLRWSQFFPREQMLVLKSEDFFERPKETLKLAFAFLELPEWEPEASQLGNKRNEGRYEQQMDPATRRRLEEYFEPHNQRLYDFLGVHFGW
jgi:hypothetical protein